MFYSDIYQSFWQRFIYTKVAIPRDLKVDHGAVKSRFEYHFRNYGPLHFYGIMIKHANYINNIKLR